VRDRLQQVDAIRDVVREPAFGAEYLARARLGQGGFRVLVTEAYGRRCAVTGERTLPVLQAAHVKPFSRKGPHVLGNGVLLRSDIHTLFDRGYVGITPDLRLVVSSRLKADFSNGREYYAHHGSPLQCLPGRPEDRPAAEYIEWHREHVFLGE
jgi:putative restriction endonuclease